MADLLDRLSRRGTLTITAEDGTFDVTLTTRGPFGRRGSCTSDKHDWWQYLRLGASSWRGEGDDLDGLLAECEKASRPPTWDIDALRDAIERRRTSRTHGPPLPAYRRWDGWSPGISRWLTVSDHASEYLDGYLRDLGVEAAFKRDRREADERRRNARQFATKAKLR